jgi:hypothetical protein
MRQLSHAERLVSLLKDRREGEAADIQKLLEAQLSHPDGIRGFMATYLTGVGDDTAADQETIPAALVHAMKNADPEDLVPLACMNVIMPTGMITMHEDREFQEQSEKTAARGVRVLASLLLVNEETKKQCDAILAVATDSRNDVDPKLLDYWKIFFEKWGYKEKQRVDIARAMREVLSSKI